MLRKNENDRYELDGVELTSGDLVQIKLFGEWHTGRIEYTDSWGREVQADGTHLLLDAVRGAPVRFKVGTYFLLLDGVMVMLGSSCHLRLPARV